MKKNLVSLMTLTLLVGLVSLTSCKKENALGDGTQFRATVEDCTSQNGKTALDGFNLNWEAGDQIAIYGTSGPGTYSATPQTPATVAVFDNVSGSTGDGPFRAFYPTTLTTDGVNITLPNTQTYVEGSINEFPMYAESSDNQLAFKNLCGVLKLHLTKANTNISSITITAASEINGTFSVSYNSGDPELIYSANGTTTTTLTCATAQSIAEGKDFYIYLPEGSYSGLQIEMNTDDSRYCVKTANTAINVTRSQVTFITLGSTLQFRPIGSKGGLFTINADGDQVWFSQGNLKYQASNAIWQFADNQYDYIGSANSNISATNPGWIDLFGWGTGNNPTLHTTNYTDYTTFVDWGSNYINNGGEVLNKWRTLNSAEWEYIFNTRSNTTNFATDNARYYKTKVNDITGVILFPDGYIHPTSVPVPTAINSNGSGGGHSPYYTLAQWAEMEAAGAVFLPLAGYRINTEVGGLSSDGGYWSSTIHETVTYCANYVSNLSSSYIMSINPLYWGFSVRLVRDNE